MCSLDVQQLLPFLYEAGKKNTSQKDTVSTELGFVIQLAAMVPIALKEDFELKEACNKIHTRSRAHRLTGLCISSRPVMHTISQVGSKFKNCTADSCIGTLGVCGVGSSRPGDATPVPVTCASAPLLRNPDAWVTQDTAVQTHREARSACTGRDN